MGETAARNRGNKMRAIGLNEVPIKIPNEGSDAHGRETIIIKDESPTRIDEVSDTLYYLGYAEYGSDERDEVWKIRKIQQVSGVWEQKYAYGNQHFRYAWEQRDTYPYG